MHDLVRLELIRESLVAVVNEMRANVIHSSYSSIIYEGQDFSCAIMAADGRQVAQSLADHPVHVFAVPYSTREVATAFAGDIHEGDIFLHNDPYTGGTHLNDVLLLYPVFHRGRLALFPAVRCHWGDVGGMTPGSISGRVTEVIQEGLRITPTRICERGRMNEGYLQLLFDNMRTAPERIGDFNTMVGTAKKAAEHLERLFRRFGGDGLLEGVEELIRRSETQMRARIAALPDGVYYNEGYIESDGPTAEPLLARLTLTIRDDEIIADFTGSSLQTSGPTNVGPSMALNSVGTIVKSFLDPRTPINHGSFAPIRVIAPERTFVNARYPAPCGGMAEVKHLLDAVVAGALSRAVPEMTIGDHKGCANHVYIAGPKPGGKGIFLLYEWPAAGTGATRGQDGNNAVRFYTEGDFSSIHPVETIEASFPLRVERRCLREGSCGDGEFRGGFGLRSEIRALGDGAQLSVISDKNVIPPYGVDGGGNGAGNRFTVMRDGEVIEPSPVPGKVSGFALRKGDLVREETSGGGGWGDPLARDLGRIIRDVELGLLSVEQARRRYGADVKPDGSLGPDSDKLRTELRAARVRVRVEAANDEMFDGPRRQVLASPQVGRRLGVGEGDLVELVGSAGPPLRGWLRFDGAASAEAVRVGSTGLRALAAAPGEQLEMRAVSAAPAP
jgi:N-methylhydantoinase B